MRAGLLAAALLALPASAQEARIDGPIADLPDDAAAEQRAARCAGLLLGLLYASETESLADAFAIFAEEAASALGEPAARDLVFAWADAYAAGAEGSGSPVAEDRALCLAPAGAIGAGAP